MAGTTSRWRIGVVRRVGLRVAAARLGRKAWGERVFFVLAAELAAGPPLDRVADGVVMGEVEPSGFGGFLDELERARGNEYLELRWRARWCIDGVERLHVARGPDGEPLYAQWLIGPREQGRALASHLQGTRALAGDERIVEAAYTFPAARGRGVMKTGMAQLLDRAKADGAARVWTYVEPDNVASLRGCAAVGFVPSRIRRERRRLGRFSAAELPLDDRFRAHWERVTGATRSPAFPLS